MKNNNSDTQKQKKVNRQKDFSHPKTNSPAAFRSYKEIAESLKQKFQPQNRLSNYLGYLKFSAEQLSNGGHIQCIEELNKSSLPDAVKVQAEKGILDHWKMKHTCDIYYGYSYTSLRVFRVSPCFCKSYKASTFRKM
jgi:hypothetical protein